MHTRGYFSLHAVDTFVKASFDSADFSGNAPLGMEAIGRLRLTRALVTPLGDAVDFDDEPGESAFSLACSRGERRCGEAFERSWRRPFERCWGRPALATPSADLYDSNCQARSKL